ncbi:MAG: carbamoyltransferase C-terminal domain-containing protein [Candidatus Doudnabacteria bacterium]|nr:carbamoyltransferase C-terminal domain-containing protein [bacterium]MDZ4244261.1 carbamoyltransferase C-terminal domain-containing protein [Candidatus Doudnabacteria bacterium]
MNTKNSKTYIGINAEPVDPSVAIVRDGKVLAFAEEERFIRYKHALKVYPIRALRYCLKQTGISLQDVSGVGIAWDVEAYSDGRLREFFDNMAKTLPVDKGTKAWQNYMISTHNFEGIKNVHVRNWRKMAGDINMPKILSFPHHYTHAFHAYMQSGFDKAVCLTIDGSGDKHCTVVWRCEGDKIEPLREITMPYSLGWLYGAITEYLGFKSKDGEYKVMGFGAYGEADPELLRKFEQIISVAGDGVEYRLNSRYIHYGQHSYSDRFTDELVTLFGKPPRLPDEEINHWHENLAFVLQKKLEEAAVRLVHWGISKTGIQNVCVGGGVGHNIKMNNAIFALPEVESIFVHPLCSDLGGAAGAALAACFNETGIRPEKLETLALGPEFSDQEIEEMLKIVRVPYEKFDDICAPVSKELARGRVVGWFQGRMEAGPRALGQRSILADPRDVKSRDRVNGVVKFREYWRPFCPSLTLESMEHYFDKYTEAPFMNLAFVANERLKKEAPAVVHIDGTARVQTVRPDHNPLFHRLLKTFEKESGVPVLLNTSFNVKGEPIVCTPQDALRTFWSTGLDALAIGSYFINKHNRNQ